MRIDGPNGCFIGQLFLPCHLRNIPLHIKVNPLEQPFGPNLERQIQNKHL
jgi:hypothetical protein